MVSPAYKACPTFVSSLEATCQLSRCCTTLLSSVGFSFSMLSGLFPVQFFHSLPLFLLLTRSFTRFPIADELILISKRQIRLVELTRSLYSYITYSSSYFTENSLHRFRTGRAG